MARDLRHDCAGGVDFQSHVDHVEHTPMTMLETVADQLLSRIVLVLVLGAAHACGESDVLFRGHVPGRRCKGGEFSVHLKRSSCGMWERRAIVQSRDGCKPSSRRLRSPSPTSYRRCWR